MDEIVGDLGRGEAFAAQDGGDCLAKRVRRQTGVAQLVTAFSNLPLLVRTSLSPHGEVADQSDMSRPVSDER